MSSPAQIQANQRNALYSTGPKSAVGRAVSAQNSTKHGFYAMPDSPALPPGADPDAFDACLHRFFDQLRPGDALEAALVTRIGRASFNLERIARAEDARVASNARHAEDDFDRAETERAVALGVDLFACAGDPTPILMGLKAFAAGASWLLARWGEYDALLDDGGWDELAQRRVLLLLGRRPNDPHDPVARKWLGQPVLGATEPQRAALRPVLEAETAHLAQLKRLKLDARADADRACAGHRALVGVTGESLQMHRYEQHAARELYRALTMLTKHRRGPSLLVSAPPSVRPEPFTRAPECGGGIDPRARLSRAAEGCEAGEDEPGSPAGAERTQSAAPSAPVPASQPAANGGPGGPPRG
jgi:hypothetical protein